MKLKGTLSTLMLGLTPTLVFAAETTDYAVNTLWVVLAAMLVFFMQAGFALLEMGLHSAKNTANVLMKNFMDFSIASLAFWIIGFAFMFGNGNSLIGLEGAFLEGGKGAFSSLDWANIPLTVKFIFQLVFAGTAATIISGSIGGRVKFSTYLFLSLGMTAFIYPILGHWVWGGGWLANLGFYDFAGSTVVHAVGGFSALAALIVIGPRLGRFGKDKIAGLSPSSMAMTGLGALILWLGWFGFNAGSTMGIIGSEDLVGHILLTTNIAAAASAVVAMLVKRMTSKIYCTTSTLNGALAGLVGITAGCAFVNPVGALFIGIVSGVLVVYSEKLFELLKIDDVVTAVSVHGVCGLWGTIAIGLFAAPGFSGIEATPSLGLFYGGDFKQLGIQILGTLVVSLCAFSATYVLAVVLDKTIGIRVDAEIEHDGLDIHEHGVSTPSLAASKTEAFNQDQLNPELGMAKIKGQTIGELTSSYQ